MINHKYELKLGAWNFSPSIKLSLITFILCYILVSLGIWQINRATYKQNITLKTQEKINNKPIELHLINNKSLEKDRFTPVEINGSFLNEYTFLLDNQILDHKVGFRVLTPAHSTDLDKWILIDRGWVPLNNNRRQLPKIDVIPGEKNIQGIINNISSGIVLHKDKVNPDANWPVLIQTIDYDFVAKQLQHPVYEFVVQLQSEEIGTYPFPAIKTSLSSKKHWGYAIQWFIFAILLVIYFIITNSKRRV